MTPSLTERFQQTIDYQKPTSFGDATLADEDDELLATELLDSQVTEAKVGRATVKTWVGDTVEARSKAQLSKGLFKRSTKLADSPKWSAVLFAHPGQSLRSTKKAADKKLQSYTVTQKIN